MRNDNVFITAIVTLALASSAVAERPSPQPLPEHPGNVFLAGERVTVAAPAAVDSDAWQLLDYDGNRIREGRGVGRIELGQLPVGYYEVRRPGESTASSMVTLGVLAPLKAPTPKSSPIACDVAMAWFYSEAQMPAVASLCTLAGANWVRDRFSWLELEQQRGEVPEQSRYDTSATVQSAAGLQVLQVNHSTPRWAGSTPGRFPADLRDLHRFYRTMAERWRGRVAAFEPWNEADIAMFGGHTGSEIASLQKACYLGLKQGNPELTVGQSVFAMNHRAMLDDFQANRVWPYFDTYNFHHYIGLPAFPQFYADHRAVSAGRPLWVTEYNIPLAWTGQVKYTEMSRTDQHLQAERLTKATAAALYEGAAALFYYLLPCDTPGGTTPYGSLLADLTPRPAYVALAATGRLLADAQPVGKWKGATNLSAYLFRAKPDGIERLVLVAWAEEGELVQPLPQAPLARFDHLGREQSELATTLALSPSPQIALFPIEALPQFAIEPPPAAAPRLEGQASPVVLQAVWPQEKVALDQSAYRVWQERIPVFVYNFGHEPAQGRLVLRGPQAWRLTLPESVQIGPGERVELALAVEDVDAAQGLQTVSIEGDFGPQGPAVLSLRLLPWPPSKTVSGP